MTVWIREYHQTPDVGLPGTFPLLNMASYMVGRPRAVRLSMAS
jgi:hypothetical protein